MSGLSMRRMVPVVCVLVGSASIAVAQGPAPDKVQGLYEGKSRDSQGEQQVEARLVALKDKNYKLLIRRKMADGQVARAELAGKTESNAVSFAAKAGDAEWAGAYGDGAVKGTFGSGGTFEIKRVVRESPTMGAKPPAGAIVLIDGRNFDEAMKRPGKDGKEAEWKIVEPGAIEVPKGGLYSKRTFEGSFNLHVEFVSPFMPNAEGQGRGNSGVFFPNGDEIQILDSFGMTTYLGGGCGGIYKYKNPDLFDDFALASAPPLQWQTYDVEYRVEMKDGKPEGAPKVTALHNGQKIHDSFQLRAPAKAGRFQFQDHGNPVWYRNIWVQPLDGAAGR